MTKEKPPKKTILPKGWVIVLDRLESLKKIHHGGPNSITISAIEIRVDLWQGPFPELQDTRGLSVLVTGRNCQAGSREALQRDAIGTELAGILDIDPQTDAPAPPQLPWIYSSHRNETTRQTAAQQIAQARHMGASAIKIVWPAGTATEVNQNHKEALEIPSLDRDFPIVSFCATSNGPRHRREALDQGQPWGYARIDRYPQGIPGLPTLQQLLQDD